MVRNTMNVPRSLFIGFEPILNELERIHTAGRIQDNYPPHNVCLLYTSDAADE